MSEATGCKYTDRLRMFTAVSTSVSFPCDTWLVGGCKSKTRPAVCQQTCAGNNRTRQQLQGSHCGSHWRRIAANTLATNGWGRG